MTRSMWKRVTRAAELRARGASWTAVAAEVKSRPEVCCRWPERYPDEWQEAYAAERREMDMETNALAIHSLRHMLRSHNERERLKAATLLVQYRRKLGDPDGRGAGTGGRM